MVARREFSVRCHEINSFDIVIADTPTHAARQGAHAHWDALHRASHPGLDALSDSALPKFEVTCRRTGAIYGFDAFSILQDMMREYKAGCV